MNEKKNIPYILGHFSTLLFSSRYTFYFIFPSSASRSLSLTWYEISFCACTSFTDIWTITLSLNISCLDYWTQVSLQPYQSYFIGIYTIDSNAVIVHWPAHTDTRTLYTNDISRIYCNFNNWCTNCEWVFEWELPFGCKCFFARFVCSLPDLLFLFVIIYIVYALGSAHLLM